MEDGRKSIPVDIYYYLSPVAIAYWIMSDGARYGKGMVPGGRYGDRVTYRYVQMDPRQVLEVVRLVLSCSYPRQDMR